MNFFQGGSIVRLVLALGGNALLRKGEKGYSKQLENVKKTAKLIADVVEKGYDIILTHGNGRQVGSILLRSILAQDEVPSLPLDVAVAESQAQIGYMIQQTLKNEFMRRSVDKSVSTIVTQVQVDSDDPAFENPTKFIGPYYPKERAKHLEEERSWIMKEDPRGDWRRVVPSPKPKEILEKDVVKQLLGTKNVVITVGGGGIPVVKVGKQYRGTPAVIDKDLASELLAEEINADRLVILTDIEKVMLNFGSPNQQPIDQMTPEEAEQYYKEGHFEAGSMGPKVKAGFKFVKSGKGRKCIISHLKNGRKAVEGEAGTVISE